MKHLILVAAAMTLLLPGCAIRGGSGGGDDDDGGGGGGGGTSTAWVRTTYGADGETEYSHDLWSLSIGGACAAVRSLSDVLDELADIADQEYEDIEEEFGGTEGPGAQEALCESDQRYYDGLLDADLAMYQPGVQLTSLSISGLDDRTEPQIPAGPYVEWGDVEWDETDAYYDGWRARINSMSWFEGWANVDCSDQDEYDAYWSAPSGADSYSISGGTLWVSNPSTNTTHLQAEDIVLVGEDDDESPLLLDADFPLCEMSGD